MKKIAIIGAGASGTLVATNLLRKLREGEVILIERSEHIGKGVAYGTPRPEHRLNVRAAGMTAFPAEPAHFVDWARAQVKESGSRESGAKESGVPEEDSLPSRFLPRQLYGTYLLEQLELAKKSSGARLTVVKGEAIAISHEGERLRITLDDGESFAVDQAVLALGNLPAQIPTELRPIQNSSHLLTDPWRSDCFDSIPTEDPVLLIGSGLTMFDVATSFAKAHFKGKIYARSRRGLIPQRHESTQPFAVELDLNQKLSRQIIKAMKEAGEGWRNVIDGLRPRTVELWETLSWRDRKRFLARLATYWDTHRHRAAPEIFDGVAALIQSGQMSLGAGRIKACRETSDGFEVDFEGPKGRETVLAKWIITCTGPSSSLRQAKLPIVESAIAAGLAEYDPLGMGLMVDQRGRADEAGKLWALGPICKGCRFETTAMPEIRVQAEVLSTELAKLDPASAESPMGSPL
jgi:uncharacterized NAD(P)/FAD-binding protein YdhS